MQTKKGTEAQGLVREEYQAFMKHFVGPLLEQRVAQRREREESMAEIPKYATGQGDEMLTFKELGESLSNASCRVGSV